MSHQPPNQQVRLPYQPPKKNKSVWILGGLAILLVVLTGVGWTLYAVGVFDGSGTGGKESASSASASAGSTHEPGDYKLDVSPQDACDDLDLTDYSEVVPELDNGRKGGDHTDQYSESGFRCAVTFQDFDEKTYCEQCQFLTIEAMIFGEDQKKEVTDQYEYYKETFAEAENTDTIRPVEDDKVGLENYGGDWQAGQVWCGAIKPDNGTSDQGQHGGCVAVIKDGDLLVTTTYTVYSPDEPDQMESDAMKDKVTTTIGDAQALLET